jgi:hypothetical protein
LAVEGWELAQSVIIVPESRIMSIPTTGITKVTFLFIENYSFGLQGREPLFGIMNLLTVSAANRKMAYR